MKILILTASNPYITAGIVALDIYKGLAFDPENNIKVIVKNWEKYPDKKIISLENCLTTLTQLVIRKIFNALNRFKIQHKNKSLTNKDYSVQDYDQTITYYSTEQILKKAGFKPDAVIVLFMQKFLSYKNLYEINQLTNAPIYLFMMDMAPMTGGCHYAWDCTGYQNTCGNCPAIYSDIENDQSRKNWEFKKRYIDDTNLIVIAGTEHLYRQLKKSSLFINKRKEKILLGIDQHLFKPGDKKQARSYFGLPENKKILLFGAVSNSNKRKGFQQLIHSLTLLKGEKPEFDLHLAIAGNADNHLIKELPFEFSLLGHLSHSQLAIAFNAADLFVCPSIEDSGPMMINQAIMSGTPIVAFEMGVALDLVKTGQTGYRAKLKNSKDLAKGINYILNLDKAEYQTMSENCRNLGLQSCHPKKQTNKIINVMELNKG